MIGKRVRLRASNDSPDGIDPNLVGQTGVVLRPFLDVNSWIIKLDHSGEAFAYECEMEGL